MAEEELKKAYGKARASMGYTTKSKNNMGMQAELGPKASKKMKRPARKS